MEVIQKFLCKKYRKTKYLWHISGLKRFMDCNVRLFVVCETPAIVYNIGKLLFSNVVVEFVNGFGFFFDKLSQCTKKKFLISYSHVENKYNYVNQMLEKAVLKTNRTLETFYHPIQLSYINELSGEYYEKSECNSTLVFLPFYEDKKIDFSVLEFDARNEEIFFVPAEFRRIRKLMQIAQKNLNLLLEYDKGKELYKVLGICKEENVINIFMEENTGQREQQSIPWAKAIIRKHMQWELRLGNQYIFSYINGNYKISALFPHEYLEEKCLQVFGGQKGDYNTVIDYVKTSCMQSHGTMLVIISDTEVEKEATRFTSKQYGMQNMHSAELDINSFNSIDGSIILDQKGVIYAIGVILDGSIKSKGNMARGARYNSALKYRDYLCKKRIQGMILIVSEDGTVEILDSAK